MSRKKSAGDAQKHPGGRPTLYRPEYCDAIVAHMAEGASATSFAASVGVCRETISEWAATHPEFSVAVKKGKAACATWWEALGRKNAATGAGSATLVIFGLKNMAPDEWREKQEIDHRSTDGTMSPTRIEIVPAGK